MSDFRASVARIHAGRDGPGDVLGAGFLVGPNLLVTCAHALDGVAAGEQVRVRFPQNPVAGEVSGLRVEGASRPSGAEDVAFLRLESAPVGVKVLKLRLVPGAVGSVVEAFGFPAQATGDGHHGKAEVGRVLTDAGAAVLQLQAANDVARGFSGSPLVDADGLVVGMVTAHPGRDGYDRGVNIAYAIPAVVLQQVGPGLQVHQEECPYPGLAPFTVEQARWFHGRARFVDEIVTALRTHRGVLALRGPSGSGKSSVVAAGLLPALADGRVPGLAGDRCRLLRPETDATALVAEVAGAGNAPGLVVIDQFEELLTHPPEPDSPDLADQVLEDLIRIGDGDGPGRVLLVLRDDFYPHLIRRCPALVGHLEQGRILNLTDRLSEADLRDIITAPAHSQGWNTHPVLTERLVRDLLEPRTGSVALTDLPLLALTLRRIWDTATSAVTADTSAATVGPVVDNTLTPAHYETVGGIRSAFATWCDRVYREIPSARQATARALVTALVRDGDPDQGVPAVRRRRAETDLTGMAGTEGDAAEVLAYLIQARIVTTSCDPHTGQSVVELAHDTVIAHWNALQVWLEQDRDQRRWLDRTEDRARQWEETGRRSGLLEDDLLAEALRRRDTGAVPDPTAIYIDASRTRQQRRTRFRRLVQAALAALTVVSLITAGIAYYQNGRAAKQRNQAIRNQIIAESGQLRPTDPSLAAQLDLVTHRMNPTPDSKTRLINTTQVALSNPLTGHTNTVSSVVFSPDGRTLASGSTDRTIRLWDVMDRGHPVSLGQPLSGHTGVVGSVVFSPDGRTLASGSTDRTIRLWSPPTTILIGHTGVVGSVVFSPDGRTLASGSADTIRLWNVADREHPVPLGRPLTGHTNITWSVAFSSDGRTLATTSFDDTIRLWDMTDREHPVPLGQPLTAHINMVASEVVFSPDERTLLASNSIAGTIRLWDLADREHPVPLGQPLTVRLVSSPVFSPDGRTLASGSADTIRLWNVADREHPVPLGQPLTGYTDAVYSVVFSPDGKTLASGSLDGTIRLWNVADREHPVPLGQPLTDHTDVVSEVVFSSDGRTLASGSHDGTIRLWDVMDRGHPVSLGQPLTGHTGMVGSVAFSPDGRTLANSGNNDTIRLWNLDVDHAIERICATSSTALTPEQWTRYIPQLPYDPPCKG